MVVTDVDTNNSYDVTIGRNGEIIRTPRQDSIGNAISKAGTTVSRMMASASKAVTSAFQGARPKIKPPRVAEQQTNIPKVTRSAPNTEPPQPPRGNNTNKAPKRNSTGSVYGLKQPTPFVSDSHFLPFKDDEKAKVTGASYSFLNEAPITGRSTRISATGKQPQEKALMSDNRRSSFGAENNEAAVRDEFEGYLRQFSTPNGRPRLGALRFMADHPSKATLIKETLPCPKNHEDIAYLAYLVAEGKADKKAAIAHLPQKEFLIHNHSQPSEKALLQWARKRMAPKESEPMFISRRAQAERDNAAQTQPEKQKQPTLFLDPSERVDQVKPEKKVLFNRDKAAEAAANKAMPVKNKNVKKAKLQNGLQTSSVSSPHKAEKPLFNRDRAEMAKAQKNMPKKDNKGPKRPGL